MTLSFSLFWMNLLIEINKVNHKTLESWHFNCWMNWNVGALYHVRIQLDFNFNKREWNWFEHDKYHRCGEGWSRGTRRREKDRRQNTILSRNLYLQLLISPQSLQFFPQGLSQQEASQAFAFFHCRPAKRLKKDC